MMKIYIVTRNAIEESFCEGIFAKALDAITHAQKVAASDRGHGAVQQEIPKSDDEGEYVAFWKKGFYSVSVKKWEVR